MKTIVCISGSGNPNSSNFKLINLIINLFGTTRFVFFDISILPLFKDGNVLENPDVINQWKSLLKKSDGLIIATPEYLHNIPAALKNALEWTTKSGELNNKKVLPITYTPSAPRGEKAMQSLIWSLQALDARVVAKLDLYQTEIPIINNQLNINIEEKEIIKEAVKLLIN